jgi:uracil-DNA glycosylase family 4
MRNSNCKGCSLHKTASTVCIWGEIYDPFDTGQKPEIMVIGEAPGAEEDKDGRPFIGRSGQLLRAIIEECAIGSVYIANTVKCRPPENRPPRTVETRSCKCYLESEFEEIKPKFLILLGASAIKWITGERTTSVGLNRNRKGWSYRQTSGKKTWTANVIATYHPAAAIRDKNLIPKIVDDILRVKSKEFTKPETVRVHCAAKACNANFFPIMSFDVETTGLNPFGDGKVLCVSWCGKDDEAYVTEDVAGFIQTVLKKKPTLIGHNIKFDLLWLRSKFGFEHLGQIYDTQIMAHLCDENVPSKGLKYLASVHTGYGDYAKEVMSSRSTGKMDQLSKSTLLNYCAMDSAATWKLYQVFKEQIHAEGLGRLLDEQMGVLRTVLRMEHRGFQIDVERMRRLGRSTRGAITKLDKSIQSEWRVDNLDSPKQLSELLYQVIELKPTKQTAKGNPSVDEDAMTELLKQTTEGSKVYKLITNLLERRKLKKMLSTYIEGLEEHLDSRGVVHPSFRVDGTVTGRFSCSNPNLQNIPR